MGDATIMASKRKDIPPPSNTDPNRPLWGAVEIGREINRKPRQAYHLLESGHLDADKVGAIWVSTRARLRASLGIKAV
jgi:hypothetical protein